MVTILTLQNSTVRSRNSNDLYYSRNWHLWKRKPHRNED